MTRPHWIRKAIPPSHKGKLDRWAKDHHLMSENGDINLTKAMRYAKHRDEKKREKEITLARTLKKFKKR